MKKNYDGWCLWKPLGGFVLQTFSIVKKEALRAALSCGAFNNLSGHPTTWKNLKKEGCKLFRVKFQIAEED